MRIFGWSQQDQMGWVAVIWGASHPSAWEANQYYSEKLKDIYIDIYIYTYTICVDMLFFMLIHIVSQPGIDKILADKKRGLPPLLFDGPKKINRPPLWVLPSGPPGIAGMFPSPHKKPPSPPFKADLMATLCGLVHPRAGKTRTYDWGEPYFGCSWGYKKGIAMVINADKVVYNPYNYCEIHELSPLSSPFNCTSK